MQLTKNQIIIIAGIGVVALIAVLVFSGIIPGLREDSGTGSVGLTQIDTTLNFWTFGDPENAFSAAVTAFHTAHPTAEIKVRTFSTFSDYNRALLDALAAGNGPDIVAIRNTDLPAMMNKLTPASQTLLPLTSMRSAFPQVVEQDFIQSGSTYAVPLSIDTLALFYNRDFLDAEGINPPATWNDFLDAAPKLARKSADGNSFTRGGAAFGTSKTIPESADILSLLLMQSGAQMTSSNFRSATFAASSSGATALSFYTQFSNPQAKAYAWNDGVGNAYDAFAQEKTAMMFGYASTIAELKKRNAFLNFAVAEAPQPANTQKPISYPSYVGYGVSRQSAHIDLAWNFVASLGTDANARAYLTATGKPAALRNIIGEYRTNPSLGVFAAQALTARSWAQIDTDAIASIFKQTIEAVALSAVSPATAIRAAQDQVTALMVR